MDDEELTVMPSQLESLIFIICGHRVMLSPHLADMYGIENRVLVQRVENRLIFLDYYDIAILRYKIPLDKIV